MTQEADPMLLPITKIASSGEKVFSLDEIVARLDEIMVSPDKMVVSLGETVTSPNKVVARLDEIMTRLDSLIKNISLQINENDEFESWIKSNTEYLIGISNRLYEDDGILLTEDDINNFFDILRNNFNSDLKYPSVGYDDNHELVLRWRGPTGGHSYSLYADMSDCMGMTIWLESPRGESKITENIALKDSEAWKEINSFCLKIH